jgi:CRP/FNR family cyclic AMP-dependent transcriptional regulator
MNDEAGSAPLRVDRRRLLKEVSIFSSLTEPELDGLLVATSTKHLSEGEILFRKGDSGRQLYGVVEGRLRIYASGPDGKEMVFHIADPGDVIGEIALLDSNPRSANVVAIEDAELLTLDRRDFLPFLDRHPRVAVQLAELLAARVRRLSELAEDSILLALRARLAKKLIALARNYGTPTEGGTRIELKLPQQALGELVGTSRESINKQLRDWTQRGLVHFERGTITVLDARGLEALATLALD